MYEFSEHVNSDFYNIVKRNCSSLLAFHFCISDLAYLKFNA